MPLSETFLVAIVTTVVFHGFTRLAGSLWRRTRRHGANAEQGQPWRTTLGPSTIESIHQGEEGSACAELSEGWLSHCPQCRSSVRHRKVRFNWTHGGEEVYLTGSFFNWCLKVPMEHCDHCDAKVVELLLPSGHYEYKFIVDSVWTADQDKPKCSSTMGTDNNLLHVPWYSRIPPPPSGGTNKRSVDFRTMRNEKSSIIGNGKIMLPGRTKGSPMRCLPNP